MQGVNLIRNVLILSISQAFAMAGGPMITLLGGVVGARLSHDPMLSTLPVSIMIVGMAIFTIPAAQVMKLIGRRRGFIASALISAIASLYAAYAIWTESFIIFCFTMVIIGANLAFVQQYRFAAVESVKPHQSSKAISFVLIGSIGAAYLGPEIASRAKDLLDFGVYSGSFLGLAIMSLSAAILLFFYDDVEVQDEGILGKESPLRELITQPIFILAVLAGVVAYGMMSFIMTATPVSMHVIEGYSLEDAAWTIQIHVMAMYLPSLFTGTIILRLGVLKVMIAGSVFLSASIFIALLGHQLQYYWGALLLLGIGWNFLFVSGTTLLTRTYRSTDRFKAQAINDFSIFGISALASLLAGVIIHHVGWNFINLLCIPLLVIMFLSIFATRKFLYKTKSPIPEYEAKRKPLF